MMISLTALTRKVLCVLSLAVLLPMTFAQCASDTTSTTTDNPTVAKNSVFFDSLYTNVSVSSGESTGYWSISTILPGTIPVNIRFATKPAAGTYSLLTQSSALDATNCMFFINVLDGANSTSYFPTSGNTKKATVTIVSGKVNVVIDGVDVVGNRGGKTVAPVKLNLMEN